ncbi:lactaldehyde reductase [Pectinatus brassicae]|uniref:Lactaldehyde reductase n=1 Tax=Pectinatus brassicae TaxID=862415 RepID=A0A840URN4_9FIRM|nr:lactaldehyde reductase [Pectinatus brassicae]MBB5335205.1 lactaldehyde reductase [Pectinatus brassicae]
MVYRTILNETSYFGKGAIKEIATEIKKRNLKKVLLVTDKDLIKFNVATKVCDILQDAQIDYEVYDNIKPNPTIKNVTDGVKFCKKSAADVIVAVGGGSSIDTSKAIAIIMTNPEFADVRSLEGASDTKNKAMPIIAVSTTSGTAAEVTINYVITDEEKNRKFVCADPHDIPVIAIVDPDMTASMPAKLCAATGMDALVHAIEGYITKGSWELTDMLHLKAIEIISRSLRSSVQGCPQGRSDMALGQYIAGMGFSNVGLGIVHSMAHPLSAVYDTPHGVACAILLTPVLKFNADSSHDKYRDIAKAMDVDGTATMTVEEARKACIAAVEKLSLDVGIPQKLSELGVQEKDIEFLAQSAIADACTPGNPRDVTLDEVIGIYKSIL